MNTLIPARHHAAATGIGRLGEFLPNGAEAFWLFYLLLIAVPFVWHIK
jgi:hypothetical protein